MTEKNKAERPARVQYARTYGELREIFTKNEIDIWAPMDVIDERLDELAIECDNQSDEPVYWRVLVKQLRNEELDAKDAGTSVNPYALWPDTGLPWNLLPNTESSWTRAEFDEYVTNIKAMRVEGHRGVR